MMRRRSWLAVGLRYIGSGTPVRSHHTVRAFTRRGARTIARRRLLRGQGVTAQSWIVERTARP